MTKPDPKLADLGGIEPRGKSSAQSDLEETKKLNRRRKIYLGVGIAGIVLLLVLFAGLGYLYGLKKNKPQVASEETKQQEQVVTYKNTRFGYQVKYPESWQTDDDETAKKIILSPRDQEMKDSEEVKGTEKKIKIEAYENNNLSSSSWVEKNISADDYQSNSSENVEYNFKGTSISGYRDAQESVFFANENFVIEISCFIPKDDQAAYNVFDQVLNSFEFVASQEIEEKTYTIQPGDTLFTISLKFDVSMESLAEYNGLENPDDIKYGMILKIPTSQSESIEKKFNISQEQADKYQEDADTGKENFRLDPVEAAKVDARGVFGIDSSFNFTLSTIDKVSGEAVVEASSADKKYLISLIQPAKIGDGGIWVASLIKKG